MNNEVAMKTAPTLATDEPAVRIGELARRAGIPPATLRAWERRYRIVTPHRTEGGYRLYSAEDERRLRSMVRLITEGLAPAEAAREALRAAESAAMPGAPSGNGDETASPARARQATAPAELGEELLGCLRSYDESGAHRVLDRALAGYGADGLVIDVVLPALRRIGSLWSAGEITVGEEHFATQLVRGRLLALSRGWGSGSGPMLLLACPPGEHHDIALAGFGLMMRDRGSRVALLGPDTPLDALAESSRQLGPDRIVLALTVEEPARLLREAGPVDLGGPVALAGNAASAELAEQLGAELLPADMLAAADRLAATV